MKIKKIYKLLFVSVFFLIFLFSWFYFSNKQKIFIKKDQDGSIIINKNKNDFVIDKEDLLYYKQKERFITKIIPENNTVIQDAPGETIIIPRNILNEIGNDSQNVHDTFIQETIKSAHKDMNIIPGYIEEKQTEDQVLDSIKKEFPQTTGVINHINKRNSFISNISKTEKQVIHDIWEKCKQDQNIKNNFITQLLDCKDLSGGIVCGTGVVTRLTCSLYINDPESMPKDKNIIKQEILGKFSVLANNQENTDIFGKEIPFDKNKAKETILLEYPDNMKEKVSKIIEEFIEFI